MESGPLGMYGSSRAKSPHLALCIAQEHHYRHIKKLEGFVRKEASRHTYTIRPNA